MVNGEFPGVAQLEGGIPNILREDYLNRELDQAETSIGHKNVKPIEWYEASKETLSRVIKILDLKEGDTLVYPWRGALAFFDVTKDLDISFTHAHFGLARDEKDPGETKEVYLDFDPAVLNEIRKKTGRVIIVDPMLATGGSIETIIKHLNPKGQSIIDETRFDVACLVAAPEGIKNLQQKFPNMHITAGIIDDRLDENGYICPGLGDFGDKWIAVLRDYPEVAKSILAYFSGKEKEILSEKFGKAGILCH